MILDECRGITVTRTSNIYPEFPCRDCGQGDTDQLSSKYIPHMFEGNQMTKLEIKIWYLFVTNETVHNLEDIEYEHCSFETSLPEV